MTNEVARAYVLSRLTDEQFRALHQREKRGGIWLTPSQIHEDFDTQSWGDVPEESQRKVAPTVHAITSEVEGQVRAKGIPFGVLHQHEIDREIRSRHLQYVGAQKPSSSRAKLSKSGQMEYDPFENE